jgi:hypothetical protein
MLGNNLSGTGRSRCPTVAALNQEGRKCSARGEASRRTTTSHWRGKSDRGVVPMKLPNKAAGAIPAEAEVVEGRPRAKGKVRAHHLHRTLRRTARALMHFTYDGRSLRWRLIVCTRGRSRMR